MVGAAERNGCREADETTAYDDDFQAHDMLLLEGSTSGGYDDVLSMSELLQWRRESC